MSDVKSPYADAVPCPKCKARIGATCTFVHFDTKQRIAASYCTERLNAWKASR